MPTNKLHVALAAASLLAGSVRSSAAQEGGWDNLLTLCLASRPPAELATIWSAWSFAPEVTLPIVAAIALYGCGYRRLARLHSYERLTGRDAGLFALGVLALCAALVSPLCRMASTLAWAHMLQHLLLVAVAPPLILLGRPGAAFAAALSAGRSFPSWPALGHPLVVSAAYGAAIWLWHAPELYQAALLDKGLHLLMYASLLFVSFGFWRMVIAATRSPGTGSAWVALSLLATIIHTGLLGALLTFSPALWYPVFADRALIWGMSPFQDQQLAGLIMWIPMAMIYLVAGMAVLAAWLSALAERADKSAARSSD